MWISKRWWSLNTRIFILANNALTNSWFTWYIARIPKPLIFIIIKMTSVYDVYDYESYYADL